MKPIDLHYAGTCRKCGADLAAAPALLAALNDAAALADALERNRKAMSAMARKAGRPDPWQVGWEPKIARLRAALAKAREGGG